MSPGESMARETLAAWEKAAGALTGSLVRDPRTLELGSGMLRSGLEWKRASDQMWQLWSRLIELSALDRPHVELIRSRPGKARPPLTSLRSTQSSQRESGLGMPR